MEGASNSDESVDDDGDDDDDSVTVEGAVGVSTTVEKTNSGSDEPGESGECSTIPDLKPDSSPQIDDSGDSDTDNLLESLDNQSHHPFRDQPDQINAHIMRNLVRGRNADSICSASTTTSVAPEVIKERVKKQFRSDEKIRQARRIRKHGEAAIQTRKRRENAYDVKTSLDAGWY